MTVLAALFTAGRFIIHWRKNHKLRWDDWFNAVALVFLIAMIVLFEIYVPDQYNAILYMKGLSDRKPTKLQAVRDMKFNIASMIFFFCTIYAVKASFLALYWQIFEVSARFRIAWLFLTAYTAIGFVVSVVTVFTRCGAPQYFANMVEKCSQRSRAVFVGYQSLWCILNTSGDLLLMILPISILRSLKMGIKQKLGLSFVFALVLIIVVLDILRTVYTLDQNLKEGQDANALWGVLEPSIAVIVCALPCYRGLLNFHTGTTQNNSKFSIGHPSSWSRLFKSSSSMSRSSRNDSKEGIVFKEFSTDGNTSNHSRFYEIK
ncbi:hypothetical protein DM02DRAFT_540184 [Periconia macrospinosa]|uniref:Rhodopsin domain-containing protein n=1 Tax=Periconia macrospinosa TaxID=97972 RepID=A0A2V1D993_9PLEO|nr:hypothetical protein DM02DRAFT_540184 [Periconia macrospinosa]